MDSEGHFYEVEQLNTLRPTHRGATIPYAAWLRDGDTPLGLNVPSVPSTKIDKMVAVSWVDAAHTKASAMRFGEEWK